MANEKHTPTPSEIIEKIAKENLIKKDFWNISEKDINEEIERIVRAVNSHEDLIKKAKAVCKFHDDVMTNPGLVYAIDCLWEAIAKAEGKS